MVKQKWRWLILLVGSYYFYISWEPAYLMLIVFSTLVDYFVGKRIFKTESNQKKNILIGTSLLLNLGFLFFFKYFNFFSESLNFFFNEINLSYRIQELNFLLPVGISFYTFQTLSYSIDIRKGILKPEYHFGKFALFVSFFPQLVAGPIERAKDLLPQLKSNKETTYNNLRTGFILILWGFFQKLFIADRLALYVDPVFNNLEDFNGTRLWVTSYFFAFQIYCDFAGYTNIARGCAKVLGINLSINFKQPYLASSISEFWRKWHITLSSWFKDYVYIPLGGNKVKTPKYFINLMIVFLVSGLWHGANWSFVIWGGIHGSLLVLEVIKRKYFNFKMPRVINVIITFQLVVFAWVFFRSDDFSSAILFFKNMFYLNSSSLTQIGFFKKGVYDIKVIDIIFSFFSVLVLILVGLLEKLKKQRLEELILKQSKYLRWVIYYILIFSVLEFGVFGSEQFIYFQF
jgi:alginate O-acetyltransferase complex protein AlgI